VAVETCGDAALNDSGVIKGRTAAGDTTSGTPTDGNGDGEVCREPCLGDAETAGSNGGDNERVPVKKLDEPAMSFSDVIGLGLKEFTVACQYRIFST
jgi:hypothetical protein